MDTGDEDGVYQVSDIQIHPSYNSLNSDYDFATVQIFGSGVAISAKVGLACLQMNPFENYDDVKLTTTGWGATSSGGNQSNG